MPFFFPVSDFFSQIMHISSGTVDNFSKHALSLVDMGITPHIPTQNRTCAINAYGFSLYILYSICKTNSL